MRTYLKEVVAKGRLEVIPEIAAEDMVDPSNPARGREGLVNHVTNFRATFPDIQLKILRIIADDDEVCGVWRMKATHSNEFIGVQPTGKTLEFNISSLFKLHDGMIVDYTLVARLLEAAMQMGIALAPSTEPAAS